MKEVIIIVLLSSLFYSCKHDNSTPPNDLYWKIVKDSLRYSNDRKDNEIELDLNSKLLIRFGY